MKKILLASAILVTTAFTANAAHFNGFYLGAQAGFVSSKAKTAITNESLVTALNSIGAATNKTQRSTGAGFGLHAGYGKNFNGFYFGGEMTVFADSAKRNADLPQATAPNGTKFDFKTTFKRGVAFGLAPRFGYAFGDNLIYVKPGIEISRDKMTSAVKVTSPAGATIADESFSTSKTNVVFTPGFGYEKAFGKVIFRAEYTYNLGKQVSIVDDQGSVTEFAKMSYSDHRFMIGAAYKF